MPSTSRPITSAKLTLMDKKASEPLNLLRTGMPSLDSIQDDTTTFQPKPGGQVYRILKTTEVDTYEKTPAALALNKALKGQKQPDPRAVAAAVRKSTGKTGDTFGGTDRKVAKLSIANAPTENFPDVASLVASLPSISDMDALHIPTDQNSNRVQQEERNIHVTGYLYAASREADNDFHLVVGCDPAAGETYMTMEVSGLPPSSAASYAKLNAARNSYKNFFGSKNLPGAGYHFYQPPVPVVVEGSLFFDATHSKGQAPGPPSLKSRMPTIFEVHPVTSITLG